MIHSLAQIFCPKSIEFKDRPFSCNLNATMDLKKNFSIEYQYFEILSCQKSQRLYESFFFLVSELIKIAITNFYEVFGTL